MKEELLKGLTEEQIEKAKACKDSDELLKLAKAEGVELTNEQLEAVAGGCGSTPVSQWKCPECRKKAINWIYGDKYYCEPADSISNTEMERYTREARFIVQEKMSHSLDGNAQTEQYAEKALPTSYGRFHLMMRFPSTVFRKARGIESNTRGPVRERSQRSPGGSFYFDGLCGHGEFQSYCKL